MANLRCDKPAGEYSVSATPGTTATPGSVAAHLAPSNTNEPYSPQPSKAGQSAATGPPAPPPRTCDTRINSLTDGPALSGDDVRQLAGSLGYTEVRVSRSHGGLLVLRMPGSRPWLQCTVEVYLQSGDVVATCPHPRQSHYRIFHFDVLGCQEALAEVLKAPWDSPEAGYHFSSLLANESSPERAPVLLRTAIERQLHCLEREIEEIHEEQDALRRRLQALPNSHMASGAMGTMGSPAGVPLLTVASGRASMPSNQSMPLVQQATGPNASNHSATGYSPPSPSAEKNYVQGSPGVADQGRSMQASYRGRSAPPQPLPQAGPTGNDNLTIPMLPDVSDDIRRALQVLAAHLASGKDFTSAAFAPSASGSETRRTGGESVLEPTEASISNAVLQTSRTSNLRGVGADPSPPLLLPIAARPRAGLGVGSVVSTGGDGAYSALALARARGNRCMFAFPFLDAQQAFARSWDGGPVSSVALGRGFVVTYDSGAVDWVDVCPLLDEKFRAQGLVPWHELGGPAVPSESAAGVPGLKYVALGGESNFYIKFEDGKMEWCGPDAFGEALRYGVNERRLHVEKVAFAPHGGWFVLWNDGTFDFDMLPPSLEDRLRARLTATVSPLPDADAECAQNQVQQHHRTVQQPGSLASGAPGSCASSTANGPSAANGANNMAKLGLKDIALGPHSEWFVIFKDHSVQADNLPDPLFKALSRIKEASGRVRSIVFGDGRSWFARYWEAAAPGSSAA